MFKLIILLSVIISAVCETSDEKSEGIQDDYNEQLQQYRKPIAKEFFHNLMRDITFHEFSATVTIPRASTECYYEDCERNSELIAAFQSNTPGSIKSKNLLRASIRFPNGSIAAEMRTPAKEGNFQLYCPNAGLYEFCIENTVDSLSSKKIEMHFMVLHHEEIVDFHRSAHLSNDTIYGLYDMMFQVFHDVAHIKLAIKHEKSMARRDWVLAMSNNDLVVEVSLLMIIIIVAVTFGQVYYLKRLFIVDSRHKNGSSVRL